MKIGRLRHRVQLLSPTITQGATGEQQHSWTTALTTWAEVRTLSGNEQARADLNAVVEQTIYRVTLRKPAGIAAKPSWQVIWEGRTLEVVAVMEPDNRQRIVQLDCVEVGL